MLFVFLILLVALLMEGIGSYISVVGLASLFASDWVILAMAIILDVAKVTSVSFLYQYWNDISKLLRGYMTASVLVLMLITSAGAFGYLSGAFQKAMQPNREVAMRIESYKTEQSALLSEKQQLLDEQAKMNQQLAKLPDDYVAGRQRLIRAFKPEQDRIRARLSVVTQRSDELRDQIRKVESENIEQQVHAGPITYVSTAFNITVEDASKWIILVIISVFDPLAIALVLAANFLVKRRRESTSIEKIVKETVQEEIVPPPPEILPESVVQVPVVQVPDVLPIVETPNLVSEFPELSLPTPPAEQSIVMPKSELANLQVNYPQALFKAETTPSKRRPLYEN